jgi:Ser/Thr protein kinase RdoA (MazF antagonist)
MTTEFDAPPPSVPLDEIIDAAAQVFGTAIDPAAPATVLPSERDQNLRIGNVVVKVSNAAEDPSSLDFQAYVLGHLERADPSLPVPRMLEPGVVRHRFSTGEHAVRGVTWLEGVPLAEAMRAADAAGAVVLRRSLGTVMGRLSTALSSAAHPAAGRPAFLWDLDRAQAVRPWLDDIADSEVRQAAGAVLDRHERHVVPRLGSLRRAIVHHDANDYNVLVDGSRVSGIIDFGDMLESSQVNELAVTLAYALLDAPDVIAAAHDVISAYTAEFVLLDDELSVLWELVATRLAMSIAISSHRSAAFPDNDYLLVSQAPAARLLQRLAAIRPDQLHFAARHAAGLEPVPAGRAVREWLASPQLRVVDPLPVDLAAVPAVLFSLADGAPATQFPSGPQGAHAAWEWMRSEITARGAAAGLGAYDEDRSCYAGDQFATDAPEPRSVHLGIDVFVEAGTPVRVPLDGIVETVADNDMPFDYGPTVIVRHATDDGTDFWSLYGHLSRRTIDIVQPGDHVPAGGTIGSVGHPEENGGWAPHVHLQVMTSLLTARWGRADAEPEGNFEGAGEPSRMDVWRSIVPNPSALLRLPPR